MQEQQIPSPFTVIYKFEIHKGESELFVKTWTELTLLIYEYEGSFGSRLHKINDEEYIGYAQWPSKLIFENSGKYLPDSATILRTKMRECCIKIEKILELNSVEVDLIQKTQHPQFVTKKQ